jgi:hypothetical protein
MALEKIANNLIESHTVVKLIRIIYTMVNIRLARSSMMILLYNKFNFIPG